MTRPRDIYGPGYTRDEYLHAIRGWLPDRLVRRRRPASAVARRLPRNQQRLARQPVPDPPRRGPTLLAPTTRDIQPETL